MQIEGARKTPPTRKVYRSPGYLLLLLDRVSQMCDQRRVDRIYDLDRNLAPVDPLEQAPPRTEEHRRHRDRELIDQASVEVLLDDVGAAGDPDIPAAGDLARLPQRALDSIVDEVERGATRALPRLAHLLG